MTVMSNSNQELPEITQGQARAKAKELSLATGKTHIADTVRPSSREGDWIRGGWAHKTSRWVVIDVAENRIAWPELPTIAEERVRG